MSCFGAYLVRFAAMVAGFVAAVFAAAAFLVFLAVGPLGWESEELPYVITGSLLVSVPMVAAFAGHLAFLPALPFMLLAEFLSLRDWLFHAIGGAVVAAATLVLLWRDGRLEPMGETGMLAAIVAAGVVGGLAYWLIAGRRAGRWLDAAESRARDGVDGA